MNDADLFEFVDYQEGRRKKQKGNSLLVDEEDLQLLDSYGESEGRLRFRTFREQNIF